MEIIPDGKAAGKQLPEQDAADGGTAGIAEPARDKNACQKINRQNTDGLLQHLRKGRDEGFLYAEEEAAKAGACCHKRHSQCQKAQGKSGAPIPKHRKGDAIRAENRTQLTATLAQRERQTACLTIRPIFPFCPRMYSCAARWEMVVVKPAEVMLHASIYSGRIS